MNAESPYDTVLEDIVTGYSDDALEDRVTDYGTSIALTNKVARAPTSGVSSGFKKDITVWSERNQRKVAVNFAESLFPVADIFDLMFPGEDPQDQIKKAVGLAIGKKVVEYGEKIIELNPIQEAAKKVLEKAFEKLQEDTEKEERLEKRQFIENYRTFQDLLQKDLTQEI